MKLPVQRLLAIALLFGIVGLLVWAFLPSAVEVDVGRVERGRLWVTVDHEGKTRVRERYVVSSPLAGRLLRVEVHAGDPIVSGKTLLAVIEPTEPDLLDARAISQTAARIRVGEAAKERAIPVLRSARASYDLAETNLGRTSKLFMRGVATRQELDDAEHRMRVATEEVKSAQFAEQIADFELALARAALARTRPTPSVQPDTVRFEIRAPVSGNVLRVLQESEAPVAAGTRLLELGDLTDLEVEVDVLSTDVVKIKPGARAVLEHWGGNAPLAARVRLVEPSAFTKVSALGVEEQRVNVLLSITDPIEKRPTLGDAFRVEARIVIWEGEDVRKIPSGALFRRGDGWAVFVVERGRARVRPVEIGQSNGLESQILNGLRNGELVVVHPSDRVKDGVRIAWR